MYMKDYYWGPVTSTIDWCEENYTVSPYIAEFFNTLTNLSYILLSLFGAYNIYRNKTSKTVYLSYFGMIFVGFGSWCFHMTLQYNMQLLDELPMLYIACVLLWHTFRVDPQSTIGTKLAIGLTIYSILVSYAYIIINDPVFHQVAYATLVLAVVGRAILLLHKVSAQESMYERAQMKKLLILAAAGFIVGFTLWNIDNIFCSTLRDWRKTVPTFTGSVSELHGWWHIGTALGAYYFVVFSEWIQPVLYKKKETYRLHWVGPVCYLRPNTLKAKSA